MLRSKTKRLAAVVIGLAFLVESAAAADSEIRPPQRQLRVDPPHISSDKSVKYDYDIVYVRAPRVVKGADGKDRHAPVWPMRPSRRTCGPRPI